MDAPLIALSHRVEFFVEEEEGQRLAILADEHIGTLHEFGTSNGLQVTDSGERFVRSNRMIKKRSSVFYMLLLICCYRVVNQIIATLITPSNLFSKMR